MWWWRRWCWMIRIGLRSGKPNLGGLNMSDTPTFADIRHWSLAKREQFLADLPPAWIDKEPIDRNDANIPDWWAPYAKFVLLLSDAFIAHITKCAPCKRMPNKWHKYKNEGVYFHCIGWYRLWIIPSDHGWCVERTDEKTNTDEVLVNFFSDAPVLCPTAPSAARVALSCFPKPPTHSYLQWYSSGR